MRFTRTLWLIGLETLGMLVCLVPACAAGDPRTDNPGIFGVALVGPVTPIDRPGVPNMRPLPGAIITVQPVGGGQEIARVVADKHGRFRLRLAAGTYLIVPLPPVPGVTFPLGRPQTVVVNAKGITRVNVLYDSGIRMPITRSRRGGI
jgi:hypothetical protein